MNNRMSELYASACLYARDKHLEDKDVPAFIQCMSDKFAELIVKECRVALQTMLRDQISRGHAYKLIEEHFGVE